MLNTLKRELHFWDSIAITVGIVIGVGIFRTPSEIAKYIDSPTLILLAWILGGAISLLGVFCYAELSSRFPETGGTYVFLREAYGKFIGFLYGWSEFSINRAASIAAVAYIFSAYLRNFVPFGTGNEKWIALAAICILTVVNIVGLHFGVRIQHVLSSFKVIAILLVAGLIFWFAKPLTTGDSFYASIAGGKHNPQFAIALIPILWSYGGWHECTFMSGEFRDTRKELPISLIVSALIVTGLYVLINAAYLRVISPAEMIESKAIASDALMRLFGAPGKVIVTIAILTSSLGALNSTILTGGRIPFSVAQDCPRLAWVGQVDHRFKTPLRSLALNGVWASVLVLWGNFEQLLFLNAFEIWLFFILAGASVFIFRRRSQMANTFSMVGYPVVPILFTIASAWLCLTTIQHAPRESFFGTLLILAGVPIYFLVRQGTRSPYKSIV